MKDSQKKRITRNYHLLRRVESWKCCRVTAFICPNCSGIQTNTWNISLKKNSLSITRNREWDSLMFFLLMMMNSASASLQVLWMWVACISLHTFQRTLRVSACRGQRTWRKVTKLRHARGDIGRYPIPKINAVSVFRRFLTRYFGIYQFFSRYCGI